MRSKGSIAIMAALILLVAGLSGCSNLFAAFTDGPKSTATLADQILAEYQANLQGSTAKALVGSRAATTSLSATQISSLVQAAKDAIAAQGLQNSKAVDQIVAAMVQGVAEQVQAAAATATPIDLSGALVVAAQSAVQSIAKTGRESNVSSGLTTEAAIAQVTAAMVKVTETAILDPKVREATKISMVKEAVAALDSAETVAPAEVSAAVATIVKEVAATQVDRASSFQNVLNAASGSAAALTKVDTTTKASMAVQVATAAVEAVAEATSTGQTVADEDALIFAIAAETSTIAPTTSSATAAAIETAIQTTISASSTLAASVSTAVTGTGTLSVIAEEQAPTVSATVSVGGGAPASSVNVSTSGTVVLLAATPSGGATFVAWTRLTAGPDPVLVNGDWTVKPATSGTFVYRVTVKNSGGQKTATADVVVISTIDVTSSADYVNQGIQYLGSQQIDAARVAFSNALVQDASNQDALFWKTFVDLMGVAINPDFVSVMRDRFGLSGYPDKLSVLLSNTWMNQSWYASKAGYVPEPNPSTAESYVVRGTFTPDSSASTVYFICTPGANGFYGSTETGSFVYSPVGQDYASVEYVNGGWFYEWEGDPAPAGATFYTEEFNFTDLAHPYLLPTIHAPSWAPSFSQANTLADYAMIMLLNVIDRNPNGLNTVLDSLVASSGPFGSDFDKVIANVKTLAQGTSIIVPGNLVSALTGETLPYEIKIGASELLAFAAQLELDKGLLQYLDSYNFNYPLGALHFDFGDSQSTMADLNQNNIPDTQETFMDAAPGPFKQSATGGLLSDMGQSRRDAARTTIATASQDLYDAVGGLQSNFANGLYDSYLPAGPFTVNNPDGSTSSFANAHDYATQYLAPSLGNYLPLIQGFHDSVVDTTGTKAFASPTGDVYLGKIFDEAAFSLPNLFEYDPTGTYPIAYLGKGSYDGIQYVWSTSVIYDQADGTIDWTTYNLCALKPRADKLTVIWPQYTGVLGEPSGGGVYLPLFSDSGNNFSASAVNIDKWALGQPDSVY